MRPWVVDASPFVFLSKLDRLSVLRDQAPAVLMPQAVAQEILALQDQAARRIQEVSSEWLEIAEVRDRGPLEFLLPVHGAGEAEVIALAKERDAARVVMDDLEARRFARRVGLKPIGTLGLLLAARLQGKIPSLRDEIRRLKTVGFYVHGSLVASVLDAAGE